jgi:anthranilate phosphoribosyltransferase
MRHAGPVRAELGVPTVFNFLGPLSHPGRVKRQVIGVADLRTAPTVVGVLQARGAPRAMVVHGHDSMDEFTTTGPSTVYELRDGEVRTYELHPEDVGIEIAAPVDIAGGDAAANAAIAERVFGGEEGPYRDIVSLNAAAGLFVAGRVDDLAAGVALAQASIDQGHAQLALERLISVAGRPRAS